MSPNCGGTSFRGSVSDLKMAPFLGPALWRAQERVCVMVAAVEYLALCVVHNDAVSVRSRRGAIPDGAGGGFWW